VHLVRRDGLLIKHSPGAVGRVEVVAAGLGRVRPLVGSGQEVGGRQHAEAAAAVVHHRRPGNRGL
jgi:hypothetical protein